MRLLILLILLLPAVANATNLATAPIGRTDISWWQTRFTATLAEARANPNAKLIWLGDSITEYWQLQASVPYENILPVWQKYYAPYNALDFGFKGDTTASLIWRLDHGQIDGLHPQLAIILIGANNLGRVHWGAGMTIPGIEAVVSNTESRLPDTHILLLGVLPSIRSQWVDSQTAAINAALASYYARNSRVSFIDVSPALTIAGKTNAALYIDPKLVPPEPALHPDAEGMARIAAFIAPEVQRYVH